MKMITRENFNTSDVVYTGYGRVSTTKEEQVISHKYQIEDLEDFFESKPEWHDSGLRYDDNGISGTNVFKRKDFQRMIKDAEAGKFNLIVLRDVSRFARYTKEFLIYLERLEECGVVVYFVNYGLLSSDPQASVILPTLAAIAEEESRIKSEYTKKGHAKRKEQGFVFGSDNRYGWDLIKTPKGQSNLLVVNEEEAKVIREIFDLYLYGRVIDGKHEDFGMRKIAHYLNQGGIRTKTGTTWHPSTIMTILSNKCLCGYVVYNKFVQRNMHDTRHKNRNKEEYIYIKSEYVEPIIDEELYYKARQKAESSLTITAKPVLDENNQPKRDEYGRIIRQAVGYKPIVDVYAQKMVCGCGSTLKAHRIRRANKDGVKPVGYTCYRYDRNLVGEEKCNNKTFDKVKLDMTALRIFGDFLSDNKKAISLAYDMIISCYKKEQEVSEVVKPEDIQKKIDSLEYKRKRLFDDYSDEKMTDELYYDRDSKLHEKIKALQDDLKVVINECTNAQELSYDDEKKKIKDALESVKLTFVNDAGYEEIDRSVIDSFVSKIITYDDGSFDWYLNLRGMCKTDYNRYKNKFAEDYKQRYEINEKAVLIDEFVIDYDEANDFVKSYGRRCMRKAKADGTPIWRDIKVKVFVEF